MRSRPRKEALIPDNANQIRADQLSSGKSRNRIPVRTKVWIPVSNRLAVSGLLSFMPLVAMTLLRAVKKEAIKATNSANTREKLSKKGINPSNPNNIYAAFHWFRI